MPKIFFSSLFDHFTYQTKGNETYNNIQANIMPLYTPLTIAGWVYRFFFYLLKVVMLHIKLTGMKHKTPCKQILCPFTNPRSLGEVKTF